MCVDRSTMSRQRYHIDCEKGIEEIYQKIQTERNKEQAKMRQDRFQQWSTEMKRMQQHPSCADISTDVHADSWRT